MAPNSKGIVSGIVRIIPNGREGGLARGHDGANECALALTQTDEIHEILDLDDPLYRLR